MYKILVVDDDDALQVLYKAGLTCEAYEVITAGAYEGMFDLIGQTRPALKNPLLPSALPVQFSTSLSRIFPMDTIYGSKFQIRNSSKSDFEILLNIGSEESGWLISIKISA